MGNHCANLALRFILELIAFFFPGYWAWKTQNAWFRIPLIVLLPIIIAAIWGVFAVPDDPSRSGKTVIAVPGFIRLIIEFAIFSIAGLSKYLAGYSLVACLFILVVILHYLLSIDRIKWLLVQ